MCISSIILRNLYTYYYRTINQGETFVALTQLFNNSITVFSHSKDTDAFNI